MKTILFTFLCLTMVYSQPKTVAKVDLNKYVGLWYEVYKIPNSFQSDCKGGTTAEYKLNEDGEIEVTNTCIEDKNDKSVAKGIARIVDKNTNAKLQVSFFSILGWRPVWGDYWIIGLGSNYEYAIVGHPERKYGWILSRKPVLEESRLQEAWDILKKNGYDVSKFTKTPQDVR